MIGICRRCFALTQSRILSGGKQTVQMSFDLPQANWYLRRAYICQR